MVFKGYRFGRRLLLPALSYFRWLAPNLFLYTHTNCVDKVWCSCIRPCCLCSFPSSCEINSCILCRSFSSKIRSAPTHLTNHLDVKRKINLTASTALLLVLSLGLLPYLLECRKHGPQAVVGAALGPLCCCPFRFNELLWTPQTCILLNDHMFSSV